jgi:hypothetical protein
MTIPQWVCVIYLVIAVAFGSYMLGCYRRPGGSLDPVNDLAMAAFLGLAWPLYLLAWLVGLLILRR